MLFDNSDPRQLHLFQSDADEALDIACELIEQMSHTGAIDRVRSTSQTHDWLIKLEGHPAYKAARQRRRAHYWSVLEETAKRVAEWPDWMKGERKSTRDLNNEAKRG